MNKSKKLLLTGLAVLAIGTFSATALAAGGSYGSTAAQENKTYTLEEMLTYADQDENLAYAEYAKIVDTLGSTRPFANIIRAEQTHIAALEKLFTAYGFTLPENRAADYVTVPASLTDALDAGIQAEKNNIAMYEQFLAQQLPEDVKTAFTALKNASEHHLAAFERSASGSTSGGQARNGNGMFGNSNGKNGMNGSGVCNGTGSGQNRGNSGTGACTGLCVYQG